MASVRIENQLKLAYRNGDQQRLENAPQLREIDL